ncbi:MAG: helix-turn-helix domain-containing protein [Lentisphaerae bacterium]|nr:helix-turn-helix domain-containing protein [Lentisphaerota bacterium]
MSTTLSANVMTQLRRTYRSDFGLTCRPISDSGAITATDRNRAAHNNAIFCRARVHALQEAVRWGEPYALFLAPGLMTWIVPLVEGESLQGGLSGGEVRVEGDTSEPTEIINFIVSAGVSRKAATTYVNQVVRWPQPRVHEAAASLFASFYQLSGWSPTLLTRNRDNALQQRQIAEVIHERKRQPQRAYPLEEERILLSLIRVGDRAAARSMLNTMLAAIFLYSPREAVIRARVIEMMGYLVRAAVEDSPLLEPLLERQQQWMMRVFTTEGFEALCVVVREALDDFMQSIFEQGYGRTNKKVRKALDYISDHFSEEIRLEAVAAHVGLSTFRIAHMVKDHTGRTILQHVKRLRIEKARHLIEETSLTCAEIAYAAGFSDQSFFTRQFREMTGTTPAKYRRERRGLG